MPLMPGDVHNVAFSKSPIGKRGYHEGEVDAFLERVEAELARLIEENNDLRDRLSSSTSNSTLRQSTLKLTFTRWSYLAW